MTNCTRCFVQTELLRRCHKYLQAGVPNLYERMGLIDAIYQTLQAYRDPFWWEGGK